MDDGASMDRSYGRRSPLRQRGERVAAAAILQLLSVLLVFACAAPTVQAAERRYRPVQVNDRSATFVLDDLAGRMVVSARLTAAGGRRHPIAVARVRRAAAHGGAHRLRVSLARSWRRALRTSRMRIGMTLRVRPRSVPVSPPSGAVLWKADAESSMTSEWASNSSIPAAASPPNPDPTRIAQSTFRAQGERSYRFELRDGDSIFASERAQLGQGRPGGPTVGGVDRLFRAGQERWISTQFYFPSSGWPLGDAWETVLALTPTSDGGAGGNVQLSTGGNRLTFQGQDNVWGSTDARIFDGNGPLSGRAQPLTKDRWIKLTYHIRFSADPTTGFIEVFGDLADGHGMRELAPRRTRATLKYTPTGAMDPAHMRIGLYRDLLLTGTQTMYVDGITVATTRAAAEANAYRVG